MKLYRHKKVGKFRHPFPKKKKFISYQPIGDRDKQTYTGKLAELRKYVENVGGLAVVKRSIVLTYLSKSQVEEFEKHFKWYKMHLSKCTCPTCGFIHMDLKKFKRYAYFWNLESILRGTVRSDIQITHQRHLGLARKANLPKVKGSTLARGPKPSPGKPGSRKRGWWEK